MYGANGPNTQGKYSPAKHGTAQAYSGQKPTAWSSDQAWLTWSNFKTNTQLVLGVVETWSTFVKGNGVDDLRMQQIMLNQYFWHKKALLSVGDFTSGYQTVGLFVGGNMAGSLLGVTAILPSEAGQTEPTVIAPTLTLKVDWTKNFYTTAVVQRSLAPWRGTNDWHDALYLPFKQPGAKAYEMLEIGYKRESAPNVKSVWARTSPSFNSSHYFDYRKGVPGYLSYEAGLPNRPPRDVLTNNNFALSGGIDAQITQPDRFQPMRGIYGGMTAQYAPPQQNLYTQYYEARGYYIGFFRKRPTDMSTFMVNHLEFAKAPVEVIAALTGSNSRASNQTNFAPSYLARIAQGVFLDSALEYCIHPTSTPKTPNALVWTESMSLFW